MTSSEMTGIIQQNDGDRMVIHVSASPDLAYLYDRLIDLVARRVFGVTDRALSAFTLTMTPAQRNLVMHRDPFDIVAIRLGYDLGAEGDAALKPLYDAYAQLKTTPDWLAIMGRDAAA